MHGNEGTEGAERALASITTGLGWLRVAENVVVSGRPAATDVAACRELGGVLAARLMA